MNNKNNKNSKNKKTKMFGRFPWAWLIGIFIFYLLFSSLNVPITGVPKEIAYSDFYRILKSSPEKIKALTKIETELSGEFTDNSKFRLTIPDNDQELLNTIRQNV